MQQAAEAEAASKARASLLRKNIQKANQKVLLEAERLKAEGKATREAASQALLAAVCCQLPLGDPYVVTDVTGSASVDRGLSSRLSDMSNGQRERLVAEAICRQQEQNSLQHRLTGDHILMRQGRGRPSSVSKVPKATDVVSELLIAK